MVVVVLVVVVDVVVTITTNDPLGGFLATNFPAEAEYTRIIPAESPLASTSTSPLSFSKVLFRRSIL